MTKPTQLVISEQARETANYINFKIQKGDYNGIPSQTTEIAEQIQLLLNSQREAIIRECAEVVRTHAQDHLTVQPSFTKITEAILAKLQNK